MNSNLFHNILTLVLGIFGLLLTFDWSLVFSDPAMATKVAGWVLLAHTAVKYAVNITRDGIGGLTKPQPPVRD